MGVVKILLSPLNGLKFIFGKFGSVFGKILSPFAYVLNSFLLKLFVMVDEPHEKIFANFIIIIVFAVLYYFIQEFESTPLFKPYSKGTVNSFDALYFSFVVHFTLGFGDIFPVSPLARTIVITHTTLFWLINLIDADVVQQLINYFKPLAIPTITM